MGLKGARNTADTRPCEIVPSVFALYVDHINLVCDPKSDEVYTDRFHGSISSDEAQSSADQLNRIVTQFLESNREMSRRLANIELRDAAYPSTAMVRESSVGETDLKRVDIGSTRDGESVMTIRGTRQEPPSETERESTRVCHYTFDKDLSSSRPYIRALRRSIAWSAASSSIHTRGWSCLSGISLADVSQISVVNLLVSREELYNSQHYVSSPIGTESVRDHIKAGWDPGLGSSSYVSSLGTIGGSLSQLIFGDGEIQESVAPTNPIRILVLGRA